MKNEKTRATPETDAMASTMFPDGSRWVQIEDCKKLERERDEARLILAAALKALPVGYIPSHTPDSIPERIVDLCKTMVDAEHWCDQWKAKAVELERELQEANEYADRLVEHKDMVCLPADLSNLRKANEHFAIENEALKGQQDLLIEVLKCWRKR